VQGVCADGPVNMPACRRPLWFYRDEETGDGMCCMDQHLQTVRGKKRNNAGEGGAVGVLLLHVLISK
jgi:hypothetical protein